jgi:hypothetical protein
LFCYQLSNSPDKETRRIAAWSIGTHRDSQTLKPLVEALNEDSSYWVRVQAASSLGEIGGIQVLQPLQRALTGDSNEWVRRYAAESLGKVSDQRAVNSLIKALEVEKHEDVRDMICVSLGYSTGPDITKALISAMEKQSKGAACSLLWHHGLKYSDAAEKQSASGYIEFNLEKYCIIGRVRWGDISALKEYCEQYTDVQPLVCRFNEVVARSMPKGFPGHNFTVDYRDIICRKRKAEISAWYNKFKHRLAWHEQERKYFLRNEETPH